MKKLLSLLLAALLLSSLLAGCGEAPAPSPEPCSALRFSVIKHSGFEEADYTETGLWLLDTLARHRGR